MENNEITLDLGQFIHVLKKHIILIVVVTLLTTSVAFIYCNYFAVRQYAATATLYLENKDSASSITSSENLNSAQKLVQNCMTIFTYSDTLAQKLISQYNLDYTVTELQECISMSIVNNTQVLQITLKLEDPALVVPVLDTYVGFCIDEFERVVNSGTIKIVNNAVAKEDPVFPVTRNFLLIGGAGGFVITYLFCLVKELFDTKIKPDDDLFTIYNIPVYAEIINFNLKVKSEYSYE